MSESTTKTNTKPYSNGGLWKRVDKNGDPYYFGRLEINGQRYEFRGFKNRLKQEGELTPDLRLFLNTEDYASKPKADAAVDETAPAAPAPAEAKEFI